MNNPRSRLSMRNRMFIEGVEYHRYRVYYRSRGKRTTLTRWYPPGFVWESLQRELEARDVPEFTNVYVRPT